MSNIHSPTIFDIIIPLGNNDIDFILTTIHFTKKNILNHRNIYLIMNVDNQDFNYKTDDNIYIINENIFAFDVAKYLGKNTRNGWYFQQLIKLYAWKFIDNLSEFYLVLDADTVFLKPTYFFNKENIPFYNITNRQHHIPYFEHLEKMHPMFANSHKNISAITNHMIFNTNILKLIMKNIKEHYKTQHKDKLKFWEIFLKCVDNKDILLAGASEYELYFNFISLNHSNSFLIRELKYAECGTIPQYKTNLDYISCHHYMRKQDEEIYKKIKSNNI